MIQKSLSKNKQVNGCSGQPKDHLVNAETGVCADCGQEIKPSIDVGGDWEKKYPLNTFGYDTTTYQELVDFVKNEKQKSRQEGVDKTVEEVKEEWHKNYPRHWWTIIPGLGFEEKGVHCCLKCGVIERRDRKEGECRGWVKVELRS